MLKRFNRSSHDTVSDYLRTGGNAFEILSVISKIDKKNTREAMIIFEALHRVLFEIIANYAHLIPNALEACRYLMNTHMNFVHTMLSSTGKAIQRKSALKLLTAMVSVNSLLGRDILSHLSLHLQIIEMLSMQINPFDKGSVRVCFIHFLMSFLVEGDLPLIRQFLSRKGILSAIIPDLIYDLPSTVNLVLTTIRTCVLENINISKTLKMQTFNTFVVQHLVKLYDWLGPCNFEKNKTRRKSKFKQTVTEVSADDKEIVLKSVHDLMLVLCTSYRFGIVFRNKSFGKTNNNPLLNMILKSIDKPWENERQQDLVIASLEACPDLYQNYMQQICSYLQPRNSNAWAKTVSFVYNLISRITPDKLINYNEQVSLKQLSNTVGLIYMPVHVLKYFNDEFFQTNKDVAVEYEALKLFQIMLKQINASINYMKSNQSDTQQFQKYITEHISNTFPSIDNILGCWILASKLKSENESAEADVEIKKPSIDAHRELILDLLISYNNCNSNAYHNVSITLDSEDILDKITSFNNDSKIDSVCMKTLELLMQINAKEFVPNTRLFEKTFLILLKQFVADSSEYVKNLILKLMNLTGLYDANKTEMEIWLHVFKYIDEEHTNAVINFLYQVIDESSKSIFKYFDKLSLLKKQAQVDDNEFVARKSAYDDLFDNVENIDDNSYTNLEINNLGPVLICAVELSEHKKYKNDQGVKLYLSHVALYLYHNYYSYRVVSHVIKNTGLALFEEYLESWMAVSVITPLKKICGKKTLMCKVSKAVLAEESIDVFKILGLNNCEEGIENSLNILGQVCVLEKDLNNVEIFCLLNMCIFYISRLTQVSLLTENIVENAQKVCFALCDIMYHKNKSVLSDAMKLFLTNPVILQHFNPIPKKKQSLVTNFVTNFVKHLKSKNDITYLMYQQYLLPYRSKVVRSMKKAIEKETVLKNNDAIDVLDLFNITFEESLTILGMLVELDYKNFISAENDASNWSNALVFALNKICSLSTNTDKLDKISTEVCSNLSSLYVNLKTKLDVEINFDTLEDYLYKLLSTFPQIVVEFSKKFKHLLGSSRISKNTAKLISLCLERDWAQKSYFIKYVNKTENISKKEIIFPLLTAALNHNFNDETVLQNVFNEHKVSIQKVIEKPHKAGQMYKDNYKMIAYIVNKCMDIPVCQGFTNKILKFEVAEQFHIEILHEVYMKVALGKTKDKKFIENYYIVLIMLLNITLRQGTTDLDKVLFILDKINKWTMMFGDESFNRGNILKHGSWEIFCKLALKNGLKSAKSTDAFEYNNGVLLKVLALLCKVFYQDESDEACTIFQMAVSHSEFVNVILQTEDNDAKTYLLELMWCIVQKNKSVMQTSHVPVYLGAYHASLSTSDRLILALLQFYEKSGVSLYEYRPFLWGETAVNHYSLKGSIGNNLWRQPSMNEVLDLLDSNMVDNTIKYYPVTRSMDATEQIYFENEEGKSGHQYENRLLEKCIDRAILQHEDNTVLSKVLKNGTSMLMSAPDLNRSSEIYDPAFFLPLFSLLFAPEAAPATGKAAVSGVTSLIWRAMGSRQSDTRSAACLALTRVRGHIDAQR